MKTFSNLLAELWEHPFTGKDTKTHHETNYFDHSEHASENVNYTDDEINAAKDYASSSFHMNGMLIGLHHQAKHGHELDHHEAVFQSIKRRYPSHYNQADSFHKLDPHEHEHVINEINGRTEQAIERVPLLDSMASKYKTHKDFHVYSGLGFHPATGARIGRTKSFGLHMPAFTSTSFEPGFGVFFAKTHVNNDPNLPFHPNKIPIETRTPTNAGHILKIHVPAGSHGIFMAHKSIRERSEKEFVLPRHAKLHVRYDRAIHEGDYDEGFGTHFKPLHVWQAKLVHDGIEPTRHWKGE
jgi:hypothetical protein